MVSSSPTSSSSSLVENFDFLEFEKRQQILFTCCLISDDLSHLFVLCCNLFFYHPDAQLKSLEWTATDQQPFSSGGLIKSLFRKKNHSVSIFTTRHTQFRSYLSDVQFSEVRNHFFFLLHQKKFLQAVWGEEEKKRGERKERKKSCCKGQPFSTKSISLHDSSLRIKVKKSVCWF